MFYIVIGAWLAGVVMSYAYGNRKLPTVILLLGGALTYFQFTSGIGYLYIAAMALLAVVIWLANKFEAL